MRTLQITATECKYIKTDGKMKEQFINGLNDEVVKAELLSS